MDVSESLSLQIDFDPAIDEDGVFFFTNIIEITRLRDNILDVTLPEVGLGSKKPSDVLSLSPHLRESLQEIQPSDGGFFATTLDNLKSTINDLCHYNAIIVIDRHMKKDFAKNMSDESIYAARNTINLVTNSETNGLIMCLWFVSLFLLSVSAILFVALSLLHSLCLRVVFFLRFELLLGQNTLIFRPFQAAQSKANNFQQWLPF